MRRFLLYTPLLVALIGAAGLALYFGAFVLRPLAPSEPVVVVIPSGTSFAETARLLEEAGVVSDAQRLRVLARFRGDARQVRAGEYLFEEAAVPDGVLDRLVAGDVRRYRVTIPEGFSLREIGSALTLAGFGESEAFGRLARDGEFLQGLGIAADSLEGYVFPETYTFVAGMSAERMIRAMVQQMRLRLTPEIEEAARGFGLDTHQLLTLASIIQKEAANREEMPLVSAVFHNRLRLRMPLQADPTVVYGIEDFDGVITRRHLDAVTPYNTYRIPALPPGPIASPGEDALRAAAFPAEADYLFFVAGGEGGHVFSRTLEEHNRAVREYRRIMSERRERGK